MYLRAPSEVSLDGLTSGVRRLNTTGRETPEVICLPVHCTVIAAVIMEPIHDKLDHARSTALNSPWQHWNTTLLAS